MESTAISLAKSVLDGVLSGVGSSVADEVARLIGVPKEVDFIHNELEMMQSFLRVASAQAAGRNDTVRTWVKQVRDLAYDVEDCLLDFATYAARVSSSSCAGGSWLPGAVAERHRIASRIRDLKSSIEELNQRNQRYLHIAAVGSAASAQEAQSSVPHANASHDVRSAADLAAFQASDFIGRESEKADLTEMIRPGGNNGARRVVSVWGMGGMGKSSLVRKAHDDSDLLDEFDCDAWVTVPHPLDSSDKFRGLLEEGLRLQRDQTIEVWLKEKRYFVIVDDLHSQEEWKHIWPVFPADNGTGSCIVVTTQREDVARHCAGTGFVAAEGDGIIYELMPLTDELSKSLLCQKVYKNPDYTLEKDMEEEAKPILKICQGLPLAISTVGGFLASRPKKSREWRNLHKHLGAELESDLRDITEVIGSSYDGLPYHLKSIFLYLSIFPENYEIRRPRLLRRWMAEGYIAKNRDMPAEDVAERFYSDLISRSMIQASEASHGVRAGRCRVHSMVLQIIRSKFIDENQLFLIENHSNEIPQSKIRHLVVSRWKRKNKRLENMNLSYVRSLTIFGLCPESLISPKLRLLRVLDLEDTENLKNDDLKHLGELQHLRYLCLRGTDISKLPSSLQNLLCLETLDIQDTRVTELPRGVAKLKKLRYLLAGVNFTKELLQKMCESSWKDNNQKANIFGRECFDVEPFSVRAPRGIEKLENLHVLGVFNVGKGHGVAGRLEKLTNLTNLRRLGVAGINGEEGQELCRSIRGLSQLERLEARSDDSLDFLDNMDAASGIPKHLVSLRLCGKLTRLPEWVSSLNNLAKVKLLRTQLQQGDIERLQNLSSLALLGLWEDSYIGDSLCFRTGMFQKLKCLDIDGLKKIMTVTIEGGAMPGLHQLRVNRCPLLQNSSSGLCGVENLMNLDELLLKECGDKENLVKILRTQISASGRKKRPKFLVGKSFVNRTGAHTSPYASPRSLTGEQ